MRSRGRGIGWILGLALLAQLGLAGCGGEKRAPVVVIGLDGAEFDLLLPWIEAGELPHLGSLLDDSAVGELETVYPILSPVCWTSAATGVNPGKHGIYDFQKMPEGGDEPIIETAEHRRALPLWMLLSDAGYRVAVMNVPMTYPPDPVRGAMISGFPFPSGDVNITYPPELQEKLGEYPIDYLGLSMRNRTPHKLYQDFLAGQSARGRVALEFLESGRYDFCWFVFTGTDKVQHFFWQHMDPNHPNHQPELVKEFGSAILDLWKKQDAILGELLAALPDEALVLVLSDHGFDAIYRQVNMANWTAKAQVDPLLDRYAIPKLLITNGLLHHFIEGRLPGSSDREAFLDEFLARFAELRDPETGQSPIESVFRREEIYEGRLLEKAPDVVFHETAKYYVTKGIPDSVELPVFQDVWSTSFSAHHRPHGILAIRGGMICPRTRGSLAERLEAGGDFEGAHITDVSPTLLALMREVIPQEMDGRPLEEAVCPGFLTENPPRIEPVEGFLLDRLPAPVLTEEERERLRALPYIQ